MLKLAETAGLATLGHVALDGTKITANASKHKAMSYERMKTRETELRARSGSLTKLRKRPTRKDKLHGASRRSDEMPGWIADKPKKRLAKIRDARQALEGRPRPRRGESRTRSGGETPAQGETQALGAGSSPALKEPDPKAQRNFTDPDSRVLLTKDGFIQGYNAQAAVDGTKQIIVAHGLTPSMSDCPQLFPGRRRPGQPPTQAQRDFGGRGLLQRGQSLALATRKIRAYVATGRAKHPGETTRKVGGEMTQTMRQKLENSCRSRYRLRKQIVEPVFGQIKQARGFRQFLLRGLEAVKAKWALICTAHNITSSPRRSEGAPISNPHAVQTLSGRAPNALWVSSIPLTATSPAAT